MHVVVKSDGWRVVSCHSADRRLSLLNALGCDGVMPGKFMKDVFIGKVINTVSLLCVEDCILALDFAKQVWCSSDLMLLLSVVLAFGSKHVLL